MLKAFGFLLLATAPVLADADPPLVATARLGVSDVRIDHPDADDSSIAGTGLTFAAQLGLQFARLEPSIAVEVAQVTGSDYEGFQPVRDIRERMVSVTARLRYSFTDFFDVTVGLGGAVAFEHEQSSTQYHGYRYELAAGFRIWHRQGQALRIEGCLANTHLAVPPDGATIDLDYTILQAGVSLGYSVQL